MKTSPKPPTTKQKDPSARGRDATRKRRGRPPRHETQTPDAPGARIIKKYGNRRLYDHTLSRPITMEEIAAAVRKGEDLRVLDGETGDDITRRILVQIILEEGNRQQLEMLPPEFLRQLIQLRSEPLAEWMSAYLTAGAQWMARQLSASGGPALRTIQDSLRGLFPWLGDGPTPSSEPTDGPVPDPQRDINDTIDELQQRLADLSKRVNRR